MKKLAHYGLGVLICILIIAGTWFFYTYCEGEKPVIRINKDISFIGGEKTFEMNCVDTRQGLRKAWVAISQDGHKQVLAELEMPSRGTREKTLTVTVDPKALDFKEGKATIELIAVDYSLRENKTSVIIDVTVDMTPPQIFPVSPSHYINPGGTCVVIYQVSEAVTKNGVLVNDTFFPAYPVTLSGKDCNIAYFALPSEATKNNTKIGIIAEDAAGNDIFSGLSYHIRSKKFRSRTIRLSNTFLERKMPEFRHLFPELKGTTNADTFVYVNEKVRQQNFEEIQSICEESQPRQLWEGPFLRMKNAATMALFGDKRTYVYQGKNITKSIHLGIDLAATRNSVITGSNNGIVAYQGHLGIYGNTVIIDHGLGLFSFYAHLSSITVEKGASLSKGQPLGTSGMSGLAGGDHLHFSIIVGKKFVNPQEWWDEHWIKDNILKKMNLTP